MGVDRNPIIYGNDDREQTRASAVPSAVELGASSVALIAEGNLDLSDPNRVVVKAPSLGERFGLCSDERFTAEPSAAGCSGTLVAPDLVLTAGHCVTPATLSAIRVVFDYATEASGEPLPLTQDHVYGLREILVRQFDPLGLDYALVRLDRAAARRIPAPVRLGDRALPTDAPVFVIGHPSGILQKLAGDARVGDLVRNGKRRARLARGTGQPRHARTHSRLLNRRPREMHRRGGGLRSGLWRRAAVVLIATACGSSSRRQDGAPTEGTGGTAGEAGAVADAGRLQVSGSGPGGRSEPMVQAGAGGDVAGHSGVPIAGGGGDGGGAHAGQGGLAGAAGAAGQGGEAGRPDDFCSAVDLAFCSDGNDCTADACVAPGQCEHAARPDGEPCDDGDACTQSDTCLGGACRGERVARAAGILSELETFGGASETRSLTFHGASAVLSPELVVYAEPTAHGLVLKLVRRDDEGWSLVSSTFADGFLSVDEGGLWATRQLWTHLLHVSATRFVLVNETSGIRTYDVVGERLELRDALDPSLKSVKGPIASALVRENRLWLCGLWDLGGFAIEEDGTISTLATLALPGGCDALGVAPDGTTLYYGKERGVIRIDVADPAFPVVEPEPVFRMRREHRAQTLQAVGPYLFVQEARFFSGAGDFLVLRADDFSVVASFPSTDVKDVVLGAVLLDTGLLLQRVRYIRERTSREFVAELYAIDAGRFMLQDEWLYFTDENINAHTTTVLQPTGAGALAVLLPSRQLIDTTGGVIRPLRSVDQGALSRVLPAGPSAAFAYGPNSSHRIDLSDPRAPRIQDGGLFAPGTSTFLRADLPSAPAGAPMLLNLGTVTHSSSAAVTQLRADASSAPRPVGRLQLDGEYATLTSGAGLLFQRMGNSDTGFSLRTFSLPTAPVSELELMPAETSSFPTRTRSPAVAVDVSANALVVVGNDRSGGSALLEWFTRDEAGAWTVLDTVSLTTSATGFSSVAVRGDRAVVLSIDPRRVDLVQRRGSEVFIERSRDLWADVPPNEERVFLRVLGFDGDSVYVYGHEFDDVTRRPLSRVFASKLDDLTGRARYEVPDQVESMAVVGGQLLFGMRTSLVVAEPACAAPLP